MITKENADKGYQELWVQLRSTYGTGKHAAEPEREAAIKRQLLDYAYKALHLYATSDPIDEYRHAMWRRRVWLHEHGRDGEIWDGTDARVWCRYLDEGKVGVTPPGLEGEEED